MPELAEVKIMGDFVNYVSSQERFFDTIEKSPVSKVKTELNVFDGAVFSLAAETRGKEMIITTELIGGDINGTVTKKLLVTMGMSGNWVYVKKDSPNLEKVLKHAHLRFISTKGNYLVMYDIRRFAKWRWVDGWSSGRGPCPLTEYNEFVDHLKANWGKRKKFNQPINELLMSQEFFNGIGNYLRAEILDRMNINPFQIAKDMSAEDIHELLKQCHLCTSHAYVLGGGQLKDWYNPNGVEVKDMEDWMQCYGKKSNIVDRTGRRFWYDPKWQEEADKTYNKDV
jgi:endonuclease VIII-like 1